VENFAAGTQEEATLSAAATLIDHVCPNNSNGKLFYLATCKKSQTLVPVTSTSTQFKACYLKSIRVTRKVSNSTTCRATENTIRKVPANSSSLYFCVDSEGVMYFKGRSEPTCGARRFAVEIGPHNRPPTAGNDGPYSVQEDGGPLSVAAPGVLANDSDPDGDSITAQLVTGPAHKASFTLNANGSFSYTPEANYNGSDSFTYKAKDTHNALSAAATVAITVTPVNDSPTNIALSNASVDENKPAGTTVGTLSTTRTRVTLIPTRLPQVQVTKITARSRSPATRSRRTRCSTSRRRAATRSSSRPTTVRAAPSRSS
jgi:VCBS repeat-containing protein